MEEEEEEPINIINNIVNDVSLKETLSLFYHNIDKSDEEKLSILLTIPLDVLISEEDDKIQHILCPVYHFLLQFLTSTKETPKINFNDDILLYLQRYDLLDDSPEEIPSSDSNDIKEALNLLDITKKIEVKGNTLEECKLELNYISQRHFSLPIGRNMIYYKYPETVDDEFVVEGVNDSVPIEYSISNNTKEVIDFMNGITIGLTGNKALSLEEQIELDSCSIGEFFGKCLLGGFSNLNKMFISKVLSFQDERLDAAILLGLINNCYGSNIQMVNEITSIMLDPSSIGCPTLQSQSLALITLGFNNLSNPSPELDKMYLSHLCSPLPTNTIGLHHIWSSCFSLGCSHFKCGFSIDQVNIMKKLLVGTRYSSLKQYCSILKYNKNYINNCLYNDRISTMASIPSACLALGFAYFNSNDKDIIKLLEIEDSLHYISKCRTDDIFIKTLSKCLITFDSIKPNKDWVHSFIPSCLKSYKFNLFELINAKYSIYAACFYAIALKNIGTLNLNIKQFFLPYLTKLTQNLTSAIEQNNASTMLNIPHFDRYQKIILLSSCMVMAGSKDPDLMKICTTSYNITDVYISYGSYSIVSLCIGLLNAGYGSYSIEPSEHIIPLLIASFYPLYEPQFNFNLIYPKYLQYLSVTTLQKRMYYCYNYSSNQYNECNAILNLTEEGQLFYQQKYIIVNLPCLIPPTSFVYNIVPDPKRYLYNSLLINGESKQFVLKVKDIPFVDQYNDIPDLNSSSIVTTMKNRINSTLNWLASIVRAPRTLTDTMIVKCVTYALSYSNEEKYRIIAEAANQCL